MILSRTCQYAIQALIFIATRPRGEPVHNREIADYLDVPQPYLAKIMQNLCKGHLLDSFRGKLGGFCLREGAEKTNLMQILILIEGSAFTDYCVLGLKVCSDATACPMHSKWKPIKQKIIALLNEKTLEKLASAVMRGKYRLTDLPNAALF
jgi:Rrf2 family protein